MQELRAAAEKAQETCGSLEIDGAIDQVHTLRRELEEIRKTATMGRLVPLPGETGTMGRLVPLPGETAENCAIQLSTNSKSVGSSMAQLLTAAAQVRRWKLNRCPFVYGPNFGVRMLTNYYYLFSSCRVMKTTLVWQHVTQQTR